MVFDEPDEVICTDAVLVPVEVYVFVTDFEVPLKLFVPLHEYVYVPSPPEGEAVQVDDCPVVIELGEALQVPDTGAVTVIVTGAELLTVVELKLPPVAVQVAMYVVVCVGATDNVPPAEGETCCEFCGAMKSSK